jgi:creatinine amidohydrolase/Fe(II)-dependent formamide hydrolase-like protein
MLVARDPERCRLELLTSTDVGAIPKDDAVVVLPVGAVEQHGPHLPLYTDSMVIEDVVRRAISRLPADANVWTIPPQVYGLSTEHLGYPGTITLSSQTLISVLRDIGRSVAASGFRKLVLVNGHGGQPHLLEMVARDIRYECDIQVFPLSPYKLGLPPGFETADQREISDGHAGEVETSTVLAIMPSTVKEDRLEAGSFRVDEIFAPLKHLTLEGKLPVAWLSPDVAPNGVLGDPRGANPERGAAVLDFLAGELAGAFMEITAFEF